MKFSTYFVKDKYISAKTVFVPSNSFPFGIPITTPFTFPIYQHKYLLALDKNNWWNPLGGHMNESEDWISCVKREALEEGGVVIDNVEMFGYVLSEIIFDEYNKYPTKGILPITHSRVKMYKENWQKFETKDRKLFTADEAKGALLKRDDNKQMYEVFEYLEKLLKLYV